MGRKKRCNGVALPVFVSCDGTISTKCLDNHISEPVLAMKVHITIPFRYLLASMSSFQQLYESQDASYSSKEFDGLAAATEQSNGEIPNQEVFCGSSMLGLDAVHHLCNTSEPSSEVEGYMQPAVSRQQQGAPVTYGRSTHSQEKSEMSGSRNGRTMQQTQGAQNVPGAVRDEVDSDEENDGEGETGEPDCGHQGNELPTCGPCGPPLNQELISNKTLRIKGGGRKKQAQRERMRERMKQSVCLNVSGQFAKKTEFECSITAAAERLASTSSSEIVEGLTSSKLFEEMSAGQAWIVADCLNRPDPDVMCAACLALGNMGVAAVCHADAVGRLFDVKRDTFRTDVHRAAALALVAMGSSHPSTAKLASELASLLQLETGELCLRTAFQPLLQ